MPSRIVEQFWRTHSTFSFRFLTDKINSRLCHDSKDHKNDAVGRTKHTSSLLQRLLRRKHKQKVKKNWAPNFWSSQKALRIFLRIFLCVWLKYFCNGIYRLFFEPRSDRSRKTSLSRAQNAAGGCCGSGRINQWPSSNSSLSIRMRFGWHEPRDKRNRWRAKYNFPVARFRLIIHSLIFIYWFSQTLSSHVSMQSKWEIVGKKRWKMWLEIVSRIAMVWSRQSWFVIKMWEGIKRGVWRWVANCLRGFGMRESKHVHFENSGLRLHVKEAKVMWS